MMIFKKAIPRRMFLRGIGASLALPLLDGMIPAFARPADTASKSPLRFGIAYSPNGMWPMDKWTPKTEGAGFEITPTMASLGPYRDRIVVLSGLAHKQAIPGSHSTETATFLTGVHPKITTGKDVRVATSMDQIAAKAIGKETQLPSLEVSLFSKDPVGTCETGYSCLYLSTLSWKTPTTPVPTEHDPRALFERLFGDSDSTDKKERLTRIKENASILDSVNQGVSNLLKGIGPGDRAKLTEYVDAIRDVERRIQLAEQQANRDIPELDRPIGVPEKYDEYCKLMTDLQILAYQADLTRVITFLLGRAGPYGGRSYPEIGVPDDHHSLSHHQNNGESIEKLYKINLYHTQMFAYYLEKLKTTQDGDGSLLDHTIMLYGSGLSNGNIHQHTNLPLLLAGGGSGKLKGGRHIKYPDDTPMTNLQLTLLEMLGVPMDELGDSTGKLNLLSVS